MSTLFTKTKSCLLSFVVVQSARCTLLPEKMSSPKDIVPRPTVGIGHFLETSRRLVICEGSRVVLEASREVRALLVNQKETVPANFYTKCITKPWVFFLEN